ncbi:MAG: hypothetical protein JWP04_2660 [Belnapia sp.]|jgi:hypothetical protein|nr:hypothetical protein [Belnapia sp.]
MKFRIALIAGLAMLGACADITAPSGPPIAGDSRGTAAPPLRTEGTNLPHSANASAGTASIAGSTGDGRPVISRTGTPSTDVGGVPPQPRLPRSRP